MELTIKQASEKSNIIRALQKNNEIYISVNDSKAIRTIIATDTLDYTINGGKLELTIEFVSGGIYYYNTDIDVLVNFFICANDIHSVGKAYHKFFGKNRK